MRNLIFYKTHGKYTIKATIKNYTVIFQEGQYWCSCLDHYWRQVMCKHGMFFLHNSANIPWTHDYMSSLQWNKHEIKDLVERVKRNSSIYFSEFPHRPPLPEDYREYPFQAIATKFVQKILHHAGVPCVTASEVPSPGGGGSVIIQ